MTALDIETIYNVVTRIFKDGQNLTQLEQRDLLNELWRLRTGKTADEFLKNTRNNRKLCIKRGTRAENNQYTGKMGEITMDTDTNSIRVHDGQTRGGVEMARADSVVDMRETDYVVAWQNPTPENNHTWYRRYKSGWVEQGQGMLSGGSAVATTHALPVEMATSNYTVVITSTMSSSSTNHYGIGVDSLTPTSFITRGHFGANGAGNTFSWYVCGMCAL